jgi:hypothetical protein
MKKLFFVAAVAIAALSLSSCKKTCKCTEAETGVEQKIKTDSQYKTCSDIEDLLESTAKSQGASWQKWSCKK